MSAANLSEFEQTEEAIQSLLNALSRQHEANKALRAQLNEIETSRGWRTLQYYYRLRNSIFPQLAGQKNGAAENVSASSGATNLKKYIWFCRSIGFKKATIHASRQVFKKKSPQTDGATGLPPGNADALRNLQKPVRTVLRGPDQAPHSSEMLLCCEEPQLAQACGPAVTIRGWSTAPSGISKIELSLDDKPLAIAHHGEFRPELAAAYPGTENIECSGFSYEWDSRGVADGPHRLTVVATSQAGARLRFVVPILLFDSDADQGLYDRWIQSHEPDARKLARLAKTANALRYQPLISIVLSFDGSDAKLLREAIASIRSQAYAKWEVFLAGFGSAAVENQRVVGDLIGADPRIRLVEPPEHAGRAAALNAALAIAKGDFVAFLDGRDTLSPDALYWVVDRLQQQRDADVLYSDEDRLFASDGRHDPFFKPDWSPDLLLSMNFMRHFLVVRRKLIEAANGFRDGFDGAEEYDLILRLVESTGKIEHISRVLYHRRVINVPGSTPGPAAAEQRGLSDYLVRNRVRGQVQPGTAPGIWRVRYEIREFPEVAVIIAAGGRVELLSTALKSLLAKTSYENYKILVVDNSQGTEVKRYLKGLAGQGVKIDSRDLRDLRPFNYSKLNNLAVKEVSQPLVLFLNDDTEVIDPDWLTALVEHGQRPEVGVAGAKLLYPSGQIQHAGVVMGLYENTAHAFRKLPDTAHHYALPQAIRNCSAVTAACMMTRRELFLRLGGFNEARLLVAFQDTDYCLRVIQDGLRVVYTPYSVLIHHESATRVVIAHPGEVRYMRTRWADVIARDPYYNSNLTRYAEDYSLRQD